MSFKEFILIQFNYKKNSTIKTDEDLAFMSAFKSFITEINKNNPNHIIINHVICALHKKRNLIKKINKYGLSKI